MARLLLAGILLAALFAAGCNKSEEDLKAIEKEASKDDAGTVIDSLQGRTQSAAKQPMNLSGSEATSGDSFVASQQGANAQNPSESLANAVLSTAQSDISMASEPPNQQTTSASPPSEPPRDAIPTTATVTCVLPGEFTVVIGSYADRKFAESMAAKYQEQQFPAFVRGVSIDGKMFYRLCVGSYETITQARQVAGEVKDRYSCDFWIDRGK